ncbi:hypothetical protein Riv7116_2944 [Rivularia sp. PCC 7116]|uniref:hypothetical protein n=1 Tax=Rivularia sp. PCC 7116 TaxID=373994 RepID=UPI00029EF7D7|nr:hypothetical protein [Rivularia sp. PCC 7116]AFY55425.1 hypothetical protein Riv7116_2944 [Rivularia sp. PCC 7116]
MKKMQKKLYSKFGKKLILQVSPIVATSVLATSPALAATFAASFGDLTFTNFNQENAAFEAINDANASNETNADDSIADFRNFSETNAEPTPLDISNIAESLVFGEGSSYHAFAETMPRFFANFDVSSNETLSFDFTTILDLEAAVDKPGIETASAAGDIAFYLLDTTGISPESRFDFLDSTQLDSNKISQNSILEYFTLAANIDALGKIDFFNHTKSQNINLTSDFSSSAVEEVGDSGRSRAISTSLFEGSVERFFERDRNVTLLAFKNTKSNVKVPESGTSFWSVLYAGLIALGTKMINQAKKKAV